MIQKVEMYTVICDNCGKDSNEGTDYSCWSDKDYVEEIANEAGWHKEVSFGKEGDKHYCLGCYSFDADDYLVLTNKKELE